MLDSKVVSDTILLDDLEFSIDKGDAIVAIRNQLVQVYIVNDGRI